MEGSDFGRYAAFYGAISPLNALLVREEVEIVKITLKTLRLVAESATTFTLIIDNLMESVFKLIKVGPGKDEVAKELIEIVEVICSHSEFTVQAFIDSKVFLVTLSQCRDEQSEVGRTACHAIGSALLKGRKG